MQPVRLLERLIVAVMQYGLSPSPDTDSASLSDRFVAKILFFLILLMFCFEIKSDLSSTIGSSTTLSASGSRGQLVKTILILNK